MFQTQNFKLDYLNGTSSCSFRSSDGPCHQILEQEEAAGEHLAPAPAQAVGAQARPNETHGFRSRATAPGDKLPHRARPPWLAAVYGTVCSS